MKLVVGLGNPGKEYAGTRHNVGFEVIDRLAQGKLAGRFQVRFQAQVAELREDGDRVLLVKPETFMNLSGQSVRRFVDYYQLPLTELLVVCDDINLPLGKLRIRKRGSHGGHNGLRDIQNHLGSSDYGRLRIGVGAPTGDDAVAHVLGRFGPTEQAIMEVVLQRAVQAVIVWVHQGIEACMNQFNSDARRDQKRI